ncbi:MAG: diguanylate cyclase [Anaerolineaceae bacterium]|nr:diguanylate cyclase [Anaerolineaceae bacterium]
MILFFLIWQKRHVKGSKYLLLVVVSVAIYNLAYALDYSATETSMKIFWSKWEYLGLANILPALALFFLEYYDIVNKVKTKDIFLLYLVPMVVIVLAWTNEYHTLIWSGFSEIDIVSNLMVFYHGKLYALGIIYQYVLGLVLLFILLQQWMKIKQSSFRNQILVFMVSIIMPILGSLVYLSQKNPIPGMDWAPIGSFFSIVLITLSITTFRFLDLIPVARDLVFNLIQDGIMVVDSQLRVVDWNPALSHLIPNLPVQLGVSAKQIFRIIGLKHNPFENIHDSENYEVEITEPELRILDIMVSPLVRNNVFDGWLVIFDDETERRIATRALEKANKTLMQKLDEIEKLQIQLKEQAIRDPLTGLFNRRFFDEYFSNELIRSIRTNTPISLLMVDIDHFKSVNDRFGHDVGDQVLEMLGEILKTMFRKSDVSCRFGGEEFLVLLPGLAHDQAFNRAEALRERFEQASREAEFLYAQVTVSIGISNYPMHSDNTRDLFRTADRALYQAKDQGRNRVCCYSEPKTNSN